MLVRWSAWHVNAVSILTALVGCITILSAATPALGDRLLILDGVVSTLIQQEATLATVLLGFALLILARSLWKRKRSAWWLTMCILLGAAILHIIKGLDYAEAFLSIGLAGWLLFLRSHFHSRSDGPSIRRAIILLFLSCGFTITYGTIGFAILNHHFSGIRPVHQALYQTLILFISPANSQIAPDTLFGSYFITSIYSIALITVVAAVTLLTRSVIVRSPATDAERERARIIIETYGNSSLAQLTLLSDKSYYFSGGGSVIAYVAENNFGIALGDPIGPEADIDAAIRGFRELCRQNGWQPAFYQTLPDHLSVYRANRMHVITIGQEAIIDLKNFSMAGRANKSFRQHVNRIERKGYSASYMDAPLSDELIATLRDVSNEWLTDVKGTEKQFSLGWFYDDYIRSLPVMVIYDPENNIVAFANILPEYQRNEVTIDLMRTRSNLDSGVMDFLFASLFNWAKEQAYATFNLGLVALAGVGDEADDPLLERGLHYLFEHLNQFYNFRGLYEFKSKFNPHWENRYLIYPGPVSLVNLAIGLIRADSGDDFIWTYLRELEIGRIVTERLKNRRLRRKSVAETTGSDDS